MIVSCGSLNFWSNHNVHVLLFLLQHEIDYVGTDAHVSPRVPQHPQIANPFANSVVPPGTGLYGQSAAGFAPRPSVTDQSKNTIFSNALSSPVRRSLQNSHTTQGAGNGGRNAEANLAGANREANSTSSNDTSMDMVSDTNEFYQWFAVRCFCNQAASHASVFFGPFLSLRFSHKLSPLCEQCSCISGDSGLFKLVFKLKRVGHALFPTMCSWVQILWMYMQIALWYNLIQEVDWTCWNFFSMRGSRTL